jgi:hypothetical protein
VEITESLFAGDTDEVTAHLAPLREAGVLVALDDFGTGFSSLSFAVPAAGGRAEDRPQLRHRPGPSASRPTPWHAVDGGAGTRPGQACGGRGRGDRRPAPHTCWTLGCDELQGYLFARPLPAAEVAPWLQRQAATA